MKQAAEIPKRTLRMCIHKAVFVLEILEELDNLLK